MNNNTSEEKMNSVSADIESRSMDCDSLINIIVDKYCKDLDFMVNYILSVLKNGLETAPDSLLEEITIKLPILIYWASSGQETVGVREDISKLLRSDVFAESFNAQHIGSVAQKTLNANQEAYTNDLLNTIYSHSTKLIKSKVSYATEIMQSVKKVLSKRMIEKEWSIAQPQIRSNPRRIDESSKQVF